MIAMALMCGPDLIIADEPTTALDVTIQAQILHLLAELQSDFDIHDPNTHDLGIVARVADKVQVMYAGRTVEEGNLKRFLTTSSSIYIGAASMYSSSRKDATRRKTWYSSRGCS